MRDKPKTIAQYLKDIPITFCDCSICEKDCDKRQVTVFGVEREVVMVVIHNPFDSPDKVAPCCVCGRDTYYDIFIAWVLLWDGEKTINGYRLCDYCFRQANADENNEGSIERGIPAILTMIFTLRFQDGELKSPEQWREATASAPEEFMRNPFREDEDHGNKPDT